MRILLVEDDFLVRDTIAYDLRERGYVVIEAESGDEALLICRGAEFDVLVTDIRMPGKLNGWDLAESCRESRPNLPVIYTTGYSDVPSRHVPGSRYFGKPYQLEAVANAIVELTSRR
ncbi:response regulator [Salinarimonas soli]|nr:response regulator [Salinarimonas soli]